MHSAAPDEVDAESICGLKGVGFESHVQMRRASVNCQGCRCKLGDFDEVWRKSIVRGINYGPIGGGGVQIMKTMEKWQSLTSRVFIISAREGGKIGNRENPWPSLIATLLGIYTGQVRGRATFENSKSMAETDCKSFRELSYGPLRARGQFGKL